MAAEGRFPTLGVIWLALLLGGIPAYSLYLDFAGILISGKVYLKRESISVREDDWTRDLSVTATYQPAGELIPSYASAKVDPDTYDRLRIGSPVTIRYLSSRGLRQFPLIVSARFADQWTFSLPKDRYAGVIRAIVLLLGIVTLAVLWRKAHINAAGWLLIPYVPFVFCALMMPRAEPGPAAPKRTARATVNQLTEVTEILATSESSGVEATQPYQIVELQFVPEGRTEPVIGVDKIDSGSIPGLTKGKVVDIDYQADRPRTVLMRGGTRTFPQKAYEAVAKNAGVYLLLLGALALLAYLFDSFWKPFFRGWLAILEESRARRRK